MDLAPAPISERDKKTEKLLLNDEQAAQINSGWRLLPSEGGFLGCVDIAVLSGQATGLFVNAHGWLCHPSLKIVSLFIKVGLEWIKAENDLPRKDVGALIPFINSSEISGFSLLSAVPSASFFKIDFQKNIQFRVQHSDGQIYEGSFHQKFQFSHAKNVATGISDGVRQRHTVKALFNAQMTLGYFLESGLKLTLPTSKRPSVSIVIALHNKAELTYNCLRTLGSSQGVPFEVIIIDNASTDSTQKLLSRIEGLRVFKQEKNLHFIRASNLGARHAKGEFLLFLNNDTEVYPDTVFQAFQTISQDHRIGAVGAKTLYPDLSVQEAGSMIWPNGWTMGYGRGREAFDGELQYQRNVHYCSGSFLMTRRKFFLESGGFSEEYSPAYYEDADYCLRLHQQGLKVIYEPRSVLIHYQGASSTDTKVIEGIIQTNRGRFLKKFEEIIEKFHLPQEAGSDLENRVFPPKSRGRILFVEDQVPHIVDGRGYPRSHAIITCFQKLGYEVTVFSLLKPTEEWSRVYSDLPRDIEVIFGPGAERLHTHMVERANYYDFMWISRPHNIQVVQPVVKPIRALNGRLKFIFDSEAISSERENLQANLQGQNLSPHIGDLRLKKEMSFYQGADHILAVSENEADIFRRHTGKPVTHLSFQHETFEEDKGFENRSDFLFVGPLDDDDTPNADSLIWFIERVWPLVSSQLPKSRFNIAGHNNSPKVKSLLKGRIFSQGSVADLKDVYHSHRVFIAPTRFSAGLPHKVTEAAAHGLPQVISGLLGKQLKWQDGVEALIASTPEDFAEKCIALYSDKKLWKGLREASLKKIEMDYSRDKFQSQIKSLLKIKP